jgi:hemerythrin
VCFAGASYTSQSNGVFNHMAYFEWSDEISVNVAEIDGQHKILIGIINDLHESIQNGFSKGDIDKILTRLTLYVQIHFDTEEQLMTETKYVDENAHKKEHFALTAKVGELYHKQIDYEPSIAFEIMDFLKTWLIDHILKIDKKLGVYLTDIGGLP